MRFSTLLSRLLAGLAWLLVLAATPARAQTAPAWASVRRIPTISAGFTDGYDIAIGADGSQYVTGLFTGPLMLGSTALIPGMGQGHLFLAKYSAAGVVQWATQLDASSGSFLRSEVAVDAAGNVYLAGNFVDAITIGSTTLTNTVSPGSTAVDGYLVKYDAQGVQQWVRQAVAGTTGNSGAAFLYGVATEASGNVVVAGDFVNTVSFGGTPLFGVGVYFCRFSPTGALLLSKRVSDAGYLEGLALDGAGNAYLAGGITGPTAFGAFTLAPAGTSTGDAFLCKLDPVGNVLWARSGGVAGAGEAAGNCVAVDAAGNAVIGGSVDANSATARLYVARFTPQGTPVWTRLTSIPAGSGYCYVADAVADGRGGFFVTGRLKGAVALGSTTLNGINFYAFVARYDGAGNAVWASQATGASPVDFSYGEGLAADGAGNVYLTGLAAGTVQFGGLPTTTGSTQAFVAQLTAGGVLAARAARPALALEAYPNPTSDVATFTLPAGGGRLAVLDALGRVVREQALPAAAGPATVALAGLAPGLYQLRATLVSGEVARTALQVR